MAEPHLIRVLVCENGKFFPMRDSGRSMSYDLCDARVYPTLKGAKNAMKQFPKLKMRIETYKCFLVEDPKTEDE